MGTANLNFDAFQLAWQNLRQRFGNAPRNRNGCVHVETLWNRWIRRAVRVVLNGSEYCVGECIEQAVVDAILAAPHPRRHGSPSHRVPLGLLLLSRQQITAEQLRSAVEAQRAAGNGKLGEWLLSLGYVNQHQITAALARQWSCPVLLGNSSMEVGRRVPPIPAALMRSCAMIPVGYVESSSTLHIAFADAIDYPVLYAIEKMTGCHTEACMALPEVVQCRLQEVSERHMEYEVVFECEMDIAGFARTVRSYCGRLEPTEVRVTAGGRYSWIRLLWKYRPPVDLLARLPESGNARLTSKASPWAADMNSGG